MKPPPFRYHACSSLSQALDLLSSLDNAKLLAGGQSLMPMLNMRFVFPDHLLDINPIADLAFIRDEPEAMRIGALTRQHAIEVSDTVAQRHPILQEALAHVGHIQTRNRGTIGGSLCHLDPAAELPAVVTAIGGEIEVASARGRRTIPMAEFPAFYMTPAIEPDEIVVAIRLPHWAPGHGYAFEEFARRHGDFAVVSASVLVELAADNTVRRIAIVLAGIGTAPIRAAAAEQVLLGQAPTPEVVSRAASLCRDFEAKADPYASAAYRQHLAGALTERALRRALQRARPAGG